MSALTVPLQHGLSRFLGVPAIFRTWPLAARYAASAVVVGLATACGRWGWPEMQAYPFFFYFPAILLSAVLFGRGSGYVATGLCGLAVAVSLSPADELWVSSERDRVALAMFLTLGLAQSALIEQLRTALDRARAVENQKDLFLQEAVHRFKNDISIISFLLRSQEKAMSDPAAKAALANTTNRIHVMSRVHDRLRQGDGASAFVDSNEFIAGLCEDLKDGMIGLRTISLDCAAERHALSHECAVAVGLIINEAVTNAVKYAFPEDRAGLVEVAFARRNDQFVLRVSDDGVGMRSTQAVSQATFQAASGGGLGSRLLQGMARQLDGALSVGVTADSPGTAVVVSFPARTDRP